MKLYTYKIFKKTNNLPEKWDAFLEQNIFLSKKYLDIFENSSPKNLEAFYIGIYENECLVGKCLVEYLDLNKLSSFGERDKCFKTMVRNFLFRYYSSKVLIVGNTMLTGQNAFLTSENVSKKEILIQICKAIEEIKTMLKKEKKSVHVSIYKDFFEEDLEIFSHKEFNSCLLFHTQPNMIFDIREEWKTEADYVLALHKKYRDQFKRARKKCDGVEKRKLELDEIKSREKELFEMYYYVARNAPFNSFFLPENHFFEMKKTLKGDFLLYGYFFEGEMIGFNTLIKNGNTMDTYFLGYKEEFQREKMLYLNMLYDMISYSIKKGFKEIVFARTALEIKSSVGAKAINMYGFMRHENRLVNYFLKYFFSYLEPKVEWQERNPFK